MEQNMNTISVYICVCIWNVWFVMQPHTGTLGYAKWFNWPHNRLLIFFNLYPSSSCLLRLLHKKTLVFLCSPLALIIERVSWNLPDGWTAIVIEWLIPQCCYNTLLHIVFPLCSHTCLVDANRILICCDWFSTSGDAAGCLSGRYKT